MLDPDDTADEKPRGGDGWPSDSDILDQAKRHWKIGTDYFDDWRQKAEEELEFVAGTNHWSEEVKRQRKGRPCLTVNRTPSFIRQITNEQRQNRPQIKFSPAEDGPDQTAAETMTGIARQIQVASDADAAIDTAFEHAVMIGKGFFRLYTDYAGADSFEQEIRFRRVPNPLSIVYDPASREPDGSDARFAFDHEMMDKAAYKRQYPKAAEETDDPPEFGEGADVDGGWWDTDTVRIAEYYWVDWKTITLHLLPDGTVTDALPQGVESVKQRKASRPVVRWAKLTGSRVLEKTDVPGDFIPVFPVYGAELDTGKKVDRWGVVRLLRDPQIQHNTMQSAATERVQLSPKAPYLIEAAAIAEHEAAWRDAATSNDIALVYNGWDEEAKRVIPTPQRQQPIDVSPGIMNLLAQSVDDMKAVTGIFDASLGNQGNEQSGRAILQRQKQSGTANFHFQDNLARALRQAGRVLGAWIPLVMSGKTQARVLGEDGKSEFKALTPDLLRLKYDVIAEVGPSYNTKRQEAAETASALAQSYPQLMQFAGDLIVKNFDWPLADLISKRLKKTLPPGLAEPEPGEQAPLPPEVQQQMQQMEQALQAAAAHAEELERGEAIKREEIASRERIALDNNETKLIAAIIAADSAESVTAFREELAHLRQRAADVLAQQQGGGPPGPDDGPAPPDGPQPESLEAPPSAGFFMPDGAQGPSPAGVSGELPPPPAEPSAPL